MRLILVLLVLLYVSFLNVETCYSKTLENEYYLKSTKCKSLSCDGIQYFIGSSNSFEVGSTITICNINNQELPKEKPIGKKHSSIGSDVLQAVANSVQSAMNGVVSSIGSLSGGSGGDDDGDDDDDDDSGSGLYKSSRELYKGGNGKVVSEKPIASFDKKHTSIGSDVLQAVSNSVQSAMNGAVSTIASLSGGGTSDDDDDDGAFVKGGDSASYKGGYGKSISDILDLIRPPRNHYAKCIKVLTVDLGEKRIIESSIIDVSKKVCIDLFGIEECKLEEQRIISAVQSTKNDGFPNEGQFYVSKEEYNTIIKHGQILRNQCQLKGKCQFTKI
ncbi:hypothetical protein ACTFIR_000967 [Dictyostelium discoideum]